MSKISMIRGDSRKINATFLQSDGVSPIDITGGKVYFTVNTDNTPDSDATASLQKTVTSHTAPTLGQTTVSLAPSDTSSLTAGTYFYDAKLIEAGGVEIALAQDKFILKPAITRSIA
jgi:hypothetical protein